MCGGEHHLGEEQFQELVEVDLAAARLVDAHDHPLHLRMARLRLVRPPVPLGAAGCRYLLFPRFETERAQHDLERVGVYHACRAQHAACLAALRGRLQWRMDAPCPSLSKRSNACLISVRWSSVSVSSVVFLGFGGITRNVWRGRVKRIASEMSNHVY